MSNSNGMYNVLNVFKKLLPLNESTAKEVAKEIYESVEAKGSILEGISKVEQKLREEYETLKTAKGTIHKVGRYGNDYDVGDDGTKKAKSAPKTGQRGRPAKEKAPEYSKSNDPFGRVPNKAPKGKKGSVVKGVAEGEKVPVKGGTVHKGHYGYEVDVNADGTKKAKSAPKTGQRGRPAKAAAPEYSKTNDLFGRIPNKAPKGSKGTVVRGRANTDTVDEDAVQDYLDNGGNVQVGKYHKPMKKEQPGFGSKHIGGGGDKMKASRTGTAANTQGNKIVGEGSQLLGNGRASINESQLSKIEHDFAKEVKDFRVTGEMDEDLYSALYDHYFDEMPYGTKKARNGDPHEWVGQRFYNDLGLDEAVRPEEIPAVQRKQAGQNFPVTTQQLDAPGNNLSDIRNLRANSISPQSHSELDELAHLAGLTSDNRHVKESIVIGDLADQMEQQQGRINVSTNASSDGTKNINISADGAAAEQLLQMLKMAGMGHSEAAHAQEVVIGNSGSNGMCDEPIEIEMDEAEGQYANVPSEEYQGVDTIIHQGDDMNREKKQFANKPRLGDNPMATENIDVVAHMGRDLMAQYQAMKIQK